MEKGIDQRRGMTTIVITGAESTGKTQLAQALAGHYGATFIPEYAREYVESLGRKYSVEDVLHIARTQVEQVQTGRNAGPANHHGRPVPAVNEGILFLDTWLVVTRVWLEVVFGRKEEWIDEAIRKRPVDLFLLCDTDIPWEPDPVRENGGEMREMLKERYLQSIHDFNYPVEIIRGTGDERTQNAIFAVEAFLKNPIN